MPRALITGASEGLGRAFAKRLAGDGYQVVAVARNEARLQKLVGELGDGGHSFLAADLCENAGVTEVAAALSAKRFDLLVNNAGLGRYGDFATSDEAHSQQMIRLNCEALVTLSRAFLENAGEGDALVNVSGVLGLIPVPGMSVYAGTKGFILSFSQALWHEQKKRGVYVMALLPGPIATDFKGRSGGAADQGPPAAITQTPDQVVVRAMKQLAKRKRPVVMAAARRAQLLFSLFRWMPRKWVLRFMAEFH
jgi:short-subunit dehydrogenase